MPELSATFTDRIQQSRKAFVFVVCGQSEHILTLHYSLSFLTRFTKYPVLVVTDSTRNETSVDHPFLLDIPTPVEYTDHQAAIFLKTGLYQWLDFSHGTQYAYLDTDVIALSPAVDTLFEQYRPPITFCTDHCRLNAFSPSAVYDEQYNDLVEKQQRLFAIYDELYTRETTDQNVTAEDLQQIKNLKEHYHRTRPVYTKSRSTYLREAGGSSLRKNLSWGYQQLTYQLRSRPHWLAAHLRQFKPSDFWRKPVTKAYGDWRSRSLQNFQKRFEPIHQRTYGVPFSFSDAARQFGYRYDPDGGKWYDKQGHFLFEENRVIKAVEARTGFRWDQVRECWLDPEGHNLSVAIGSDKLKHKIRETFGVTITEENWQHWNGGVFLFDKQSIPFLSTWHKWSLRIFSEPAWKTRDQGTLIAAVWEHGLQDHATLPLRFNFLADYFHPTMRYLGDFRFDLNENHRDIRPVLLHVYHHWGDVNWAVWADVADLRKRLLTGGWG